jgi:hypothetical protein
MIIVQNPDLPLTIAALLHLALDSLAVEKIHEPFRLTTILQMPD